MIGRFEYAKKTEINPVYAWGLIATLFAAFLSFFLSFQLGVFALLFAIIAWWVWQYPEEGFVFLLVILPILPMLKITQTIGTISLVKDVIIITLFLKTFFIPLLTKKLAYRRNILWAPIVALTAWSLVTTVMADSLILGILRLRDIVLYILLFFGVLYLQHTRTNMRQRLVWGLTSFITVLLLAAWQWFFAQDSAVLRFDPVARVWIPRLSSILAHPSIFGEYVITAASLLVPLFLFTKKVALRTTYAILFALSVIAIFLSYSRGVWLGLAAALGVITLIYVIRLVRQNIGVKKLTSYGLVVLVVLSILGAGALRFTPAGGFVRSIVDPTYGSNEERLTFFVRLIAPTTTTQAIFGRGLGDVLEQNFRSVDLETYDIATGAARSVQLTKNRTLVDNQYLKTFVEMGVVGLVLYGWIYWRLIVAAVRKALTDSKPIISLWSLGFLAAFMIQALVIDIWDIFPTNALFWIITALLSQSLVNTPEKSSPNIKKEV